MKNNTTKAVVVLSVLSVSPIASSSSTVYATDLIGFTGFLNVVWHVFIALSPLFAAIVLIHIVHYFYKGNSIQSNTSLSASMPVAKSCDQSVFNEKQSRASKLAPPPIRVEESSHKAVGPTTDYTASLPSKYAFLIEYPDIKRSYYRVIHMHSRIKNSDMSLILKQRADGLKSIAEKTISTLRSMHKVGPVSENNISHACRMLSDVIEALSEIVENYQVTMGAELDKIKISDTFKKQDELEQLRTEGLLLLDKIKDDSSFDSSEDKFRLDKIVHERLDQVWHDYTDAKRKYCSPAPNETLLITNERWDEDPDITLKGVFLEIRNIYNDIELGIKTQQKDISMTKLMANQNYFESR